MIVKNTTAPRFNTFHIVSAHLHAPGSLGREYCTLYPVLSQQTAARKFTAYSYANLNTVRILLFAHNWVPKPLGAAPIR
jgi:hypothetical protein